MFFYYQLHGGEEGWSEALADQRQAIIASKRPKFVTVLDVSALVTDSMSREEINALKYSGPLYFDWDADGNIELALSKVRQFLDKLVEIEVDLHSIRLYATGGRGFHAELPMGLFMAKPPKQGVQYLPAIYKEMCFELYTDTMDLRVYTARRGRMWRAPGVRRENGKFKVALTVDEALNMSASDYDALCSHGNKPAPAIQPPALNPRLALAFEKAKQKVEGAAKKRKDSVKDLNLLARFKGQYPPSLLKVMSGEVKSDQGFHPIAMQVAITTNALGKKEDEMLALCEGLCETHQSDGSRYNTPAKRRAELSRMFRYTADNVCYGYSRDAVRKLLPADVPSPDLDGLTEEAGAVVGETEEDDGLYGGVFLTESGIYRRNDEGALKICDVAFRDVLMLADAYTQKDLGLDAEVLVKGHNRGRRLIEQQTFLSRANFQKFCMQYRGGFTGNDNQVVATSLRLRDMAMENGGLIYLVSREGLDLIQNPEKNETCREWVWVSPEGIETQSEIQYKHRGNPTIDGIYKSDLLTAPQLKGDNDTAAVIDAMLNVNVPFVVGSVLGWMTACFHRQAYHALYRQFPLLMVFGAAGCGKSTTIADFLGLHYHLVPPVIKAADGDTNFAIEGALMSSASIPCVLDEYKPREMSKSRHPKLKGFFRAAYNAATFSKGGMSRDLDSNWKDIRSASYCAPICFIGEAIEPETAIMERSVIVPVQKNYLNDARRQHHETLLKNRTVLSSLGREVARATLYAFNWEKFEDVVAKNREVAAAAIGNRNNDRPIFNLAVVLTGLAFVQGVLQTHFGSRFDAKIEELKAGLQDGDSHVVTTVKPEASKVLDDLAHISRSEDAGSEFAIRFGYEYVQDSVYLDIKPRDCYVKYSAWCRRKGQTPYYDTLDAMLQGLSNYGPLVSKAPMDSVLKVSAPMEKVFRFSLEKLKEEGVEPFKE